MQSQEVSFQSPYAAFLFAHHGMNILVCCEQLNDSCEAQPIAVAHRASFLFFN